LIYLEFDKVQINHQAQEESGVLLFSLKEASGNTLLTTEKRFKVAPSNQPSNQYLIQSACTNVYAERLSLVLEDKSLIKSGNTMQ
jgi:hypothetical protein